MYKMRSVKLIATFLLIFTMLSALVVDTNAAAEDVTVYFYTNPSNGGSINISGSTLYNGDSRVLNKTLTYSITANPNTGYAFTGWSSSGVTVTNVNSATTTVTGFTSNNHTLTANFSNTYSLTVNNPTGVTISASPAPQSNGKYNSGTVVTLTYTESSGYAFTGWSGAVSGTTSSVKVTMNGDKTVSATSAQAYTLNITNPTGITITADPAPQYNNTKYQSGTIVTLVYTESKDYKFTGWTGAAAGTDQTAYVTMNANKSVSATSVRAYTLTVSADPDDGGTITGGGKYAASETVTLKAIPNSYFSFAKWTGDTTGIANTRLSTVSFTMGAANRTINAAFLDNSPLLTYEPSIFTEAKSNDGTITGTKTVIIDGAAFADVEFKEGIQYSTNCSTILPGLKLDAKRLSETRVLLSLSGNATNHTTANSVTNLSITFNDSAFQGITAAGVRNTSRSDFAVNFINSNPIRILEVYPSAVTGSTVGIRDALSSFTGPDYQVTSMSLNKFISMIDDLNGNYDIVYFGSGRYFRNDVNARVYGTDITDNRASKVLDFINAGQLCIFHEDAFKNDALDGTNKTKMSANFNITSITSLPNVKIVNSVSSLSNAVAMYSNTTVNLNKRPKLSVYEKPVSYKIMDTPLESKLLTFTFRVNDDSDSFVNAKLYIDRNNDSLFQANELIQTHRVNNDKYDTMTYRMPANLTGVFFWKLEIEDSNGAQDELSDVFFLKGDEMTVRVLQILPPSNNGDLVSMFNKDTPDLTGNKIGQRVGEYKIDVTQVSYTAFNSPGTNDTLFLNDLNGHYDMICIGFQDSYGNANLNQNACDRIYTFIQTGQSVMFTHDLVAYAGYQGSWNFRDYKPLNLSTGIRSTVDFRTIIGQTSVISAGQTRRDGTETALITNYNLNGNGDLSRDYSQINVTASTNDPLSGVALPTFVKKVNTSAVTLYPFNIESVSTNQMRVAQTHIQYYKLNLEDPSIITLFNLNKSITNERLTDDAMNSFYTYSKGNITYSGTGHSSGYPDYEIMLFANTMMKAYTISNHAPSIDVYDPVDLSKISLDGTKVDLSFKPFDFDYYDTNLMYKVYIDRLNNGTFEVVKNDTSIANGELVKLGIDKGFNDARTFKIKIEAWDQKLAKSSVTLTLYNTQIPVISPEIVFDGGKTNYLVGEAINVTVKVNTTGRVATPVTVVPTVKLKIPSTSISYNGGNLGTTLSETLPGILFNSTGPSVASEDSQTFSMLAAMETGGNGASFDSFVNYTIDGTAYNQQRGASVNIRQGAVKVYVKDTNGNPIKNAKIHLNGGTAPIGTSNTSGYFGANMSGGSKTFTVTAPAGYKWIRTTVNEDVTGATESVTNNFSLNYDHYSWVVNVTVDIDVQIPVTFYKIQPGNTLQLLGDDTAQRNLRTYKNSKVRILAKLTLPVIEGSDVRGINFGIKTTRGGIVVTDPRYVAEIVNSNVAIPSFTPTQLKAANSITTGSYDNKDYYIVIEMQKADQQQFSITYIRLVMENGTTESVPLHGVSVVNVMEIEAPPLR